jgi:hypothetical protein
LRIEGVMDLARHAVQGHSSTVRQWVEHTLAGGAAGFGSISLYNMDPGQMTSAAVAAALLAGRRGIDQRVARRVAEMLTANDPNVLGRGIRLVARNERLMDGLRATDQRFAVAGGEQSAH